MIFMVEFPSPYDIQYAVNVNQINQNITGKNTIDSIFQY